MANQLKYLLRSFRRYVSPTFGDFNMTKIHYYEL